MELKDRIRRAREAVGWTQAALAAEVGVDPKTVRNWESGTHPRRSLGAIERVLGVDLTSPANTSVSLDEASDGQLLQHLAGRLAEGNRRYTDLLAERDRQVAELNAEIERLRGNPSTAEGRWAARVRES